MQPLKVQLAEAKDLHDEDDDDEVGPSVPTELYEKKQQLELREDLQRGASSIQEAGKLQQLTAVQQQLAAVQQQLAYVQQQLAAVQLQLAAADSQKTQLQGLLQQALGEKAEAAGRRQELRRGPHRRNWRGD